MPGEPQLGSNPVFGIDCTSLQVLDPAGQASHLIIRSLDAFRIDLTFQFDGTFAPAILNPVPPLVPPFFRARIFYSGLGGAPDGTLYDSGSVPTAPAPAPASGVITYLRNCPIPVPHLTAGLYTLTAVVELIGYPATAHLIGPVIQIV